MCRLEDNLCSWEWHPFDWDETMHQSYLDRATKILFLNQGDFELTKQIIDLL